MNDGWREVSLGDVFDLDNARLGEHTVEPTVLSLSKYEGFVRAEDYFDRRIASASLDAYKTVAPDSWAFSTIHIDEGSIARNHWDFLGAISPMYTTMRWVSSEHDPAYFELLLTSPAMLLQYAENARGSINRRRSLPFASFAALQVRVPPLDVQRRIVDLIGAMDSALLELVREIAAGNALLQVTRRTLLSELTGQTSQLHEVAEVRLGRMLSKERSAGSDLAPYIRNANVQWDGLGLEDLKAMSFPIKERTTYELRRGDLLVCEGGDPGRTVLLDRDLPGVFYQKAVHRVRVLADGALQPGFLYHWLAECYADGRIADLCTNTTIKHLTAEKFRTLPILIPISHEQSRIVELLDRLREQCRRLADERTRLLAVRHSLLVDLLSGDREIPTSYGALIGAVA